MNRIFYLLTFMFVSAQTFIGQDIIRIDPGRISSGTLVLSDMIESIEYIQLETDDNCLIGDVKLSYILLSKNYILVCCTTTKSYFLFNRMGKFIAKIGNRGNGPSDYIEANPPFAIDEENQQIILAKRKGIEQGELMYYDLDGKYIRSVSVDGRLTEPRFHTIFDGKHIIMHLNNPWKTGEPPFDYSLFSSDYKLITQKIKKIDYVSTQLGVGTTIGSYYYYLYNGQMHVKIEVLNDTVYSINKDLDFFPKYIINSGSYSFTKQIISDAELFIRESQNRVRLRSVFETNNNVLISYSHRGENFYLYHDKRQRRSLLFHSDFGIPNDYDGGLDFWPEQQNSNEFIAWYNAYLFKENENKLKPIGNQKVVGNFENLRKEIDSDANPVIVVVKMKQ